MIAGTERVSRLPTVAHRFCWFCRDPLGRVFTSVKIKRSGVSVFVHCTCRRDAGRIARMAA